MRTMPRTLCITLLLAASALAACSDGPTAAAPDPGLAGMDDPKMGVGWVPGTPGECDPWLDLNWCKGPTEPGGPCMHTGSDSGIADAILGCLPPGGGPGVRPA
jgi:hypothetical protein